MLSSVQSPWLVFSLSAAVSLSLSLFRRLVVLPGPSLTACSSPETSRCPFHRNSPFLRSSLPRAFQTSPSSLVSERRRQGKGSPPLLYFFLFFFTLSRFVFLSLFRLDFLTLRIVCFSSRHRENSHSFDLSLALFTKRLDTIDDVDNNFSNSSYSIVSLTESKNVRSCSQVSEQLPYSYEINPNYQGNDILEFSTRARLLSNVYMWWTV